MSVFLCFYISRQHGCEVFTPFLPWKSIFTRAYAYNNMKNKTIFGKKFSKKSGKYTPEKFF